MKLISILALTLASISAFAGEVDTNAKRQTVETLIKTLNQRYVFPDKAAEVERALKAKLASGGYDSITDGMAFARSLTADVNAIAKDAHFNVQYSEETLPPRREATQPSPAEIENYRRNNRLMNGAFERVERLIGNVGYIKFNGFAAKEDAARPIKAAMEFVADTDALIFDVRDNGGGSPGTVQLLCSYLFGEKPVHLNDLYWREGNQTTQFWTLKKVEGKRYLDREVYILTSKRTGSAAEEFTYNLKNLRRAMVVGSTTWGGANPGGVVRLNDHFAAFVPTGRAINPITKTNWEGTGVEPDISVKPEEALKTAHALAVKRLRDKATRAEDKERLTRALSQIER